ncbi:MAG: hypothetical protein KZQ60_19515 [Candidatus Thiodiazotropha sp. (ex Lucinoma aequizonata)]|nr:hypothetical protein [Candidatus Thiodiazotropha sp. (ex Lucinoma aequizonata)]
MKITIPLLTILSLLTVTVVQAETGLINVSSQFGVQETADRFVAAVEKVGLKVFNPIDHAAGAAKVE